MFFKPQMRSNRLSPSPSNCSTLLKKRSYTTIWALEYPETMTRKITLSPLAGLGMMEILGRPVTVGLFTPGVGRDVATFFGPLAGVGVGTNGMGVACGVAMGEGTGIILDKVLALRFFFFEPRDLV